jgi:ribose transport system ATP-binding protein
VNDSQAATAAGDSRPRGLGEVPPALAIRHLSKSFGRSVVLDDVTLTIRPGEIWGLLGQNGSGKSTLIKILAGYHAPDPGGELDVHGEPVRLPLSAGQWRELGLAFVHQDLGLFPKLSILDNLTVGTFRASSPGMIHWGREREAARRTLRTFNVDLEPDRKVASLSGAERAMVAIVRAADELRRWDDAASGENGGASGGRGVLVLDEPTVFLPKDETARLYELIREVAAQGAAVLLVSHHLSEIRSVTDHIAVLRDGKLQGTWLTGEVTDDTLVRAIVGREASNAELEQATEVEREPPVCVISDLEGGRVVSASFAVHPGEILGLTGLVGSGFEDVPYLLFGALPARQGSLRMRDRVIDLVRWRPRDAMEAKLALVPGDRLTSGGIGKQSVASNLTLPTVSEFFSGGRLRLRRERAEAADALRRFSVRPPDPGLQLGMLSGGNQQKVILAKWLRGASPELLLLHEPTQGVDVGARAQVYELLSELSLQGVAMICASTDFEQLEKLCQRVLVFRDGVLGAELQGDHVTEERMANESYRI